MKGDNKMKNDSKKGKVNSPYSKPCHENEKTIANIKGLQKMHEVISTEAAQGSTIIEQNKKAN